MAHLRLLRFSSGNDSTLGILMRVDFFWKFLCFTLEDEFRTMKKSGETRIPSGAYQLKLRQHGGFHGRYTSKFPEMHHGMIEIMDVPGFTDVLIHIGNNDDDTEGCILVGDIAYQNITEEGRVLASTSAYERVYPALAEAILKEDVWIDIIDYDDAKVEA
jgi:hypothetical protein